MPNHTFHIANLIAAHFQGRLNAKEKEELEAWLNEDGANQEFLKNLSAPESLRSKLAMLDEVNEQSTWEKTIQGIRAQDRPSHMAGLWKRIAVAASIILVVGTGLWFSTKWMKGTEDPVFQHAGLKKGDIAPGSFGATLTLANGQKIALSDAANGQLARESGVVISKTADGQLVYEIKATEANNDNLHAINTLTTAKGQTYIIVLPDKSMVWMNAASSLSYSAALVEEGQRKVKLEGEAYFEITKDKAHPFVVESRGQQVEVLGTHFNINSYTDESSVKTTLLEGSVKIVANSAGGANAILYPNQQAILTNVNRLSVVPIETDEVVAWKNGITSFKDAEIKTIMRQVARWYDVEVKYQEGIPKKLFSGDIPRNANLSEFIKVIEFAGVRLKVEGRTILVMP